MATNTAPQWLKNTDVFNHSTVYLLCVIASFIDVYNTMQVCEHVSVNLVISSLVPRPKNGLVHTVLRMRVIPRKTWESVHV